MRKIKIIGYKKLIINYLDKSLGVNPNSSLKTRLNHDGSLKPTSYEISEMVLSVVKISSLARCNLTERMNTAVDFPEIALIYGKPEIH